MGCGMGYFVRLAKAHGYRIVRAVDFSSVAVNHAREICSNMKDIFRVGDLRSKRVLGYKNYDVAVLFEVLEHVEEDLAIIENIRVGKRLIFSVPNYGYRSHVRYFEKLEDVLNRYSKLINFLSWESIAIDESRVIWLLCGVRHG
jgi:2-polyprenyl-3-methyl-5-hydroxy-6-metoxy-1,4-benzoquinol methylase